MGNASLPARCLVALLIVLCVTSYMVADNCVAFHDHTPEHGGDMLIPPIVILLLASFWLWVLALPGLCLRPVRMPQPDRPPTASC